MIGIDFGLEAQVIAERHLGKQRIVLVAEDRDTTVLAGRWLHDLCRPLETKSISSCVHPFSVIEGWWPCRPATLA